MLTSTPTRHHRSSYAAIGMLSQASSLSSSFCLPLLHRGLRTSASAWDAVDVKVPAMGESVTEGTIASVLKKTGGCSFCMGAVCAGAWRPPAWGQCGCMGARGHAGACGGQQGQVYLLLHGVHGLTAGHFP